MTQVRIPRDIYHHPQTGRSCAAKEKLIPMLRKVSEASSDYFFFAGMNCRSPEEAIAINTNTSEQKGQPEGPHYF